MVNEHAGKSIHELQDCIEELLAKLATERKKLGEFGEWLEAETIKAHEHNSNLHQMPTLSRKIAYEEVLKKYRACKERVAK